jgi:hypothetical protein
LSLAPDIPAVSRWVWVVVVHTVLFAPRNMCDEIISKLNVGGCGVAGRSGGAISPVDRGIDLCEQRRGALSRFAEGRCQQMWWIIKQLGVKREQGVRSRGELGLVLRCEFAEGQVRSHK